MALYGTHMQKCVCCITGLCIHPTDCLIVIQIHPGKKKRKIKVTFFILLVFFLLMHFIQDYYFVKIEQNHTVADANVNDKHVCGS